MYFSNVFAKYTYLCPAGTTHLWDLRCLYAAFRSSRLASFSIESYTARERKYRCSLFAASGFAAACFVAASRAIERATSREERMSPAWPAAAVACKTQSLSGPFRLSRRLLDEITDLGSRFYLSSVATVSEQLLFSCTYSLERAHAHHTRINCACANNRAPGHAYVYTRARARISKPQGGNAM